jgi:hypothetical protein
VSDARVLIVKGDEDEDAFPKEGEASERASSHTRHETRSFTAEGFAGEYLSYGGEDS